MFIYFYMGFGGRERFRCVRGPSDMQNPVVVAQNYGLTSIADHLGIWDFWDLGILGPGVFIYFGLFGICVFVGVFKPCLLYTSPSPRDRG